MKTWTEDTWTPWKRNRRIRYWADPGTGTSVGSDPGEGQIGLGGYSMGGDPSVVGMDVATGDMGFGQTALATVLGQNMDTSNFSQNFASLVAQGFAPSDAASIAAAMGIANPSPAAMMGAANFNLGLLAGVPANIFGVPNPVSIANMISLNPVGLLGITPGMADLGSIHGGIGSPGAGITSTPLEQALLGTDAQTYMKRQKRIQRKRYAGWEKSYNQLSPENKKKFEAGLSKIYKTSPALLQQAGVWKG